MLSMFGLGSNDKPKKTKSTKLNNENNKPSKSKN